MKIFLLSILAIFFIGGCSSKQYYKPEDKNWFGIDKEIINTPAYIKAFNAKGATLDDNRILNSLGISSFILPEGFLFVNNDNNGIIAANKNGDILLTDTNQTLNFKTNVIAATKKENLLALVFTDNSIGIYDINGSLFKMKQYLTHSYINDTRFAMPVFLNKIILFPSLDGKVLIVDKESFKVIRTITVDPQNETNNIILLEAIDDTLIAASQNKIITINSGKFFSKDFFIQNYILDEKYIYVALLDGTVMKLDLELNVLESKKFKFAKLQAIALDKDKNIYLIESQGYIIKIGFDFKTTTVYPLSLEEDEIIYVNKNKVYFENKLLNLN